MLDDYEEGIEIVTPLDDYEESILQEFIFTNKKWWQFWKPKKVYGDIGTYTKVGRSVQIVLNGGKTFTYKEDSHNQPLDLTAKSSGKWGKTFTYKEDSHNQPLDLTAKKQRQVSLNVRSKKHKLIQEGGNP